MDGDFLPSVFFIHVHPWSIKLLVKAMAVPMIDELAELGSVMDQRALTYILNETDFRDSVVYQPWHWFDASSAGPKDDANRKGTMLAQFPTSLKGSRWKLMSDCLDGLEKVENGKMIPLEDSFYSKEITRWWDLAKDVLFMLLITTELQKNLHDWNEDVAWASASLAEVLSYGMDQRQLALETIQEAKHIVDNTKLPSKKLDAVDKGQWIEPL